MTNQELEWLQDLQEIYGEVPNLDEYHIVHHDFWCGYEDSGHMFILQKGSQYFMQSWQCSPYSDSNEPEWAPDVISYDEALEEIADWESYREQSDGCF